jgi:hypothetical protein
VGEFVGVGYSVGVLDGIKVGGFVLNTIHMMTNFISIAYNIYSSLPPANGTRVLGMSVGIEGIDVGIIVGF